MAVKRAPRETARKIAAPSVPYWVLIISTGNFNADTPYPVQRPLPCEDGMRLWSEILQVDTLFRKIFNHYRPELHYMRGPGPKWFEKHSAVAECAMPQVSGSGGSNPSLPPAFYI